MMSVRHVTHIHGVWAKNRFLKSNYVRVMYNYHRFYSHDSVKFIWARTITMQVTLS